MCNLHIRPHRVWWTTNSMKQPVSNKALSVWHRRSLTTLWFLVPLCFFVIYIIYIYTYTHRLRQHFLDMSAATAEAWKASHRKANASTPVFAGPLDAGSAPTDAGAAAGPAPGAIGPVGGRPGIVPAASPDAGPWRGDRPLARQVPAGIVLG